MITSYINIDSVIEEINRESIPNTYWNIEEIKEWVYKALSFIDNKANNIQASDIIEIDDYKGLIPANVEIIDKVLLTEEHHGAEDTQKELHSILPHEQLNSNNYDINAGYIYVEFETGKLTLQYYTTPVDEQGRPLIPNEKYYIQAVIAFIRFKLGSRAYWQGKILERQLQMLEQEWLFYIPAAQNSQKMKILRDSKRFKRISNRYFF